MTLVMKMGICWPAAPFPRMSIDKVREGTLLVSLAVSALGVVASAHGLALGLLDESSGMVHGWPPGPPLLFLEWDYRLFPEGVLHLAQVEPPPVLVVHVVWNREERGVTGLDEAHIELESEVRQGVVDE